MSIEAKKTELNGYAVWYDGYADVGTDEVKAVSLMLSGVPTEKIVCRTAGAKILNQRSFEYSIKVRKEECMIPEKQWTFNGSSSFVSIKQSVLQKVNSSYNTNEYIDRVNAELAIFESCEDGKKFIECVQYMVEQFNSNDMVWGVGRGSSCASLVLFLMGIHCVDPVKYDIDMQEFFGEQNQQTTVA